MKLRRSLSKLDLPEPWAHAKGLHHAAGDIRRLAQVIVGAGGDLVVDQLFGGTTAQQHGHLVLELRSPS